MPQSSVPEYVARHTGVDLQRPLHESSLRALVAKTVNQPEDGLTGALYKAVVKFDGENVLTGNGLTASELSRIRGVAVQAVRSGLLKNPVHVQRLQEFGATAGRFESMLTQRASDPDGVCSVINKQEQYAYFGSQKAAVPRHTIIRHREHLYEIMTWMTTEEMARLEARFAQTTGLFSLDVEKSVTDAGAVPRVRDRQWGGQQFTEYKVTLGSGAFGSARIARRVSDDQYMIIKKTHPKDYGPKPDISRVIDGVNDGGSSGVIKVHDSFFARSTRDGGVTHTEKSAYTLTEMGVIDTHKFINLFSIMSYALNDAYINQPLCQMLRNNLLSNSSEFAGMVVNTVRLRENPCRQPELVRVFRNTMAFQMLEAVHQMHQKDMAHNDIKPDNFVLAYDENKNLRVKLIDFDLSRSVSQTVGKARDTYAIAFTAPQASKAGVNNRADVNDAFSLGCTFRLLSGQPLIALLEQSQALRGQLVDSKGKEIKPVEDRRAIEARFKHVPEITTLNDLSHLLCHPHMQKRYTVSQAMQSPLFTQPGNVMSSKDFSNMAEKIIRHGQMVPSGIQNALEPLKIIEAHQRGGNGQDQLGSMSDTLSSQDRGVVINRYINAHGEPALQRNLARAKNDQRVGNSTALLRRGMRQLNIGHHLKSDAEKEASYKYKS